MLKIDFKFEYTRLTREKVTHFSEFISVKVKKISGSILGKAKKIEAQAK